MDRKQLLISSNPYENEIEYTWWNFESDEWERVRSSSKLASEDFTRTNIRNKCVEIIEEINENFNIGSSGLDIIFEGTEDDFELMNSVLEAYYSKSNILCRRGNHYIQTAEEIMPEIKAVFEDLKNDFKNFETDDIGKELTNFSEVVKPSISLCVIGLFSTGKSAFINALIGREVLASDGDPTTAKNYKIFDSKEETKILFRINNDQVKIVIEDSKLQINNKKEYKSLKEIQNKLNTFESLNQDKIIYELLSVLNNIKVEGEEISSEIELYINFNNSSLPRDEFNFVIFDTPGSDTATFKEHKEILKDALSKQTNGLPIFMTEPDGMDKESNNEIIELMGNLGSSLDIANTLVIVNKADSKTASALSQKKERINDLCVTSWKSTRVLFVSSIVGLGCKKEDPLNENSWNNSDYFFEFDNRWNRFSDPSNRNYIELYKYNFMPRTEAERYEKEIKGKTDEIPFINTGIHCVEQAISDFSRKSALYNKCINATDYLKNAITLTIEATKKAEEEQTKLNLEIDEQRSEKEKELIKTLNLESEKLEKQYFSEYTNTIKPYIKNCYKKEEENESLKVEWSKKKNKKERIVHIEKYLKERCNLILNAFKSGVDRESEQYWDKKQDEYKNACVQIITESPHLSNKQKKELNEEILNIPKRPYKKCSFTLYDIKAYRPLFKFFGFPVGEVLDFNNCFDGYTNKINTEITNINQSILSNVQKHFKAWKDDLIRHINTKLVNYNKELAGLAKKQQDCIEKIERIRIAQDKIENKLEKIQTFFEFKENSEI